MRSVQLPQTFTGSRSDCFIADGADATVGVLFEALAAAGYTEREQIAVRTAVLEAWSNAVEHGNGGDRQKSIVISYIIKPQYCRVTLQDHGDGFDPSELPDPTSPENLHRDCPGRGVLIMRHFMSKVEFVGNRVTLTLRRGERW